MNPQDQPEREALELHAFEMEQAFLYGASLREIALKRIQEGIGDELDVHIVLTAS